MYLLHYPSVVDKDGLIFLASTVNLETTSPKDCQFILGEMGIFPKNSLSL